MDTPTTPLLPLGATARRLRVPSTWLRDQADAGLIPHIRAGKQYLFDLDQAESWLRSQIHAPGAPAKPTPSDAARPGAQDGGGA